jgi:hypothetical protein
MSMKRDREQWQERLTIKGLFLFVPFIIMSFIREGLILSLTNTESIMNMLSKGSILPMEESLSDFIKYDIDKILTLKENYEASASFLLSNLPDINYNSPKEIIDYIDNKYGVKITNARIVTIKALAERYLEEDPSREILEELVAYLKLKFTLKNYINCILSHEKCGKVELRLVGERLSMPNKQPLSHNEELNAAITSLSVGAAKCMANN